MNLASDKLTDDDRALFRRLIGREGTFSIDQLAEEIGVDWRDVFPSIRRLVNAGKLWHSEGSRNRYTLESRLQRRPSTAKIGVTALRNHQPDCRVNRRAPG